LIHLCANTPIWIATDAQDFRKGIDGFACLCRSQLKQDPANGCIFVFINRSKTMIRILAYEENGFWLMTKRLSLGKYQLWPSSAQAVTPLMAKQLRLILSNASTSGVSDLFSPLTKNNA